MAIVAVFEFPTDPVDKYEEGLATAWDAWRCRCELAGLDP